MSDSSQGEGWWIASDGKWYPPESAPTPPPTEQQPPTQQPPAQPTQPTQQQPPAQQPPPAPGQAGGQQPPAQQPPPAPGQAGGQQPPPAPGQTGIQQPPPAPGQAGGPPPFTGAPGQPPGTPPGPEEEKKGGKGKWIALVIVLLLVAGGVAAFFLLGGDDDADSDADATEEDTDIGDATGDLVNDGPIEFDKEYSTELEGDRTEARYTLDAPAGAIMTVEVANRAESSSGVYTTFQSAGERYLGFRTAANAAESEQVILAHDGEAEFELIFTEGPAAFTFKVGLEIQDDAGEGGDAGSELSSAFSIGAGQGVAGLLGGKDSTDHYTVDVEPGSELTLTAKTTSDSDAGAYFTVQLAGDRLLGERVAPGAETDFSMLLSDTDSGTLEVIVTEGPATYEFTVDFVEQTDGGEPGDAPSELAEARSVDPASPIEGTVGDRDEGDFYTFTAPGPTFNVSGTATAESDSGFYIDVQDASGSRVAGFRIAPGATDAKPVEVEPGSEVRLKVTEGRAAYSITVG